MDVKLAIVCAGLAEQSYEQLKNHLEKTTWVIDDGYELIAELDAKPYGFFAHYEPFGFIAEDQDKLFIVFRGTDSWDDWFSNAMCEQNDRGIHTGFESLYRQMADTIKTVVKLWRREKNNLEIIVTGHSLGGALATLCAADLHGDFPDIQTVTFASPRVMNAKNAADYTIKTWRIVNTEDVVPTLPLPILGDLIYQHVGTPINFTVNTGDTAGNHAIDTYKSNLEKML